MSVQYGVFVMSVWYLLSLPTHRDRLRGSTRHHRYRYRSGPAPAPAPAPVPVGTGHRSGLHTPVGSSLSLFSRISRYFTRLPYRYTHGYAVPSTLRCICSVLSSYLAVHDAMCPLLFNKYIYDIYRRRIRLNTRVRKIMHNVLKKHSSQPGSAPETNGRVVTGRQLSTYLPTRHRCQIKASA
jgi:hypothetical protein